MEMVKYIFFISISVHYLLSQTSSTTTVTSEADNPAALAQLTLKGVELRLGHGQRQRQGDVALCGDSDVGTGDDD